MRRDFIRKAAFLGAAAAVGSTFLGSKIVPESSARSCVKSRVSSSSCELASCCPTGDAIYGRTCSGIGVVGYAQTTGVGVYGVGTKSVGVAGISCSYIGVKGSSPKSVGVVGVSCLSYGVQGYSSQSVGVYGQSSCSYAVEGYSPKNVGVLGESCCSVGVYGYSPKSVGVFGDSSCSYAVKGVSLKSVGVSGSSAGACGIGVEGVAANSCAIPIVARGETCQSANLQQWRNSSCEPLSVVNKCGWLGINTTTPANPLCVNGKVAVSALGNLGIGTTTPATALQVNGGISAKVTIATSNYSMSALDFGVLANAASAALTVTLPAASTALGMVVFVKKIDSSSHAVTLAASGTDKIEGKSSERLSKQYESYELVSDGSSNWYVISNDTK